MSDQEQSQSNPAREELRKIISDPSHPDHAGYMRGDPDLADRLNAMYRGQYGDQRISLGTGITVKDESGNAVDYADKCSSDAPHFMRQLRRLTSTTPDQDGNQAVLTSPC